MALRQEVAVPKVESQRSANTANATVTVRTITTVGDEPGSETRHGEDVAASSHTPSRVGTPGSVEYDHPRGSTVPHRFFGLPDTIVRVDVRLVPARWVTPDGEWRNPERDVLSGWHECDHPRDPGVTPGWPRVASPIAS